MSDSAKAAGGLISLVLITGAMAFRTCRSSADNITREVIHSVPAPPPSVVREIPVPHPPEPEPHIPAGPATMQVEEPAPTISSARIPGVISELSPAELEAEAKSYGKNDQLIKDNGNGTFTYFNHDKYFRGSLHDIPINPGEILRINNLDGLKPEDKNILAGKGVKFLIDEAYYHQIKNQPARVRPVYIASTHREKMMKLLAVGEKQLGDIKKLFAPIFSNRRIITAESTTELMNAIKTIRSENCMPVLIFNNQDNMLFGWPAGSYGAPVITCNSYRFGDNDGFASLDFLSVAAINKTLNEIFNPGNNTLPSELEFFQELNKRYVNELRRTRNKQVMLCVAGGAGTLTAAGYIVYYNSQKK